jgi:hypothetical protein
MDAHQIEAYADAAAAAVGLPLLAEHRPGVIHYLTLAAALADLVMAHPLAPADEPAEAFRPVEPRP